MTKYRVISEDEYITKAYKHINCYGIKFDLIKKEGWGSNVRFIYYAKHNNMDLCAIITYDIFLKEERYCEVNFSIDKDGEQIFYRAADGRFGLFNVLESLTSSLLEMDQDKDSPYDFEYTEESVRGYVNELFMKEFKRILAEKIKDIPKECSDCGNIIQKLIDFNSIKDILE